MADGDVITSGHGETEDEIDDDQVKTKWAKPEASFQFDNSGKLKLRDDFLGVNIFKSRSKVDPGPRRCEFKDGAVATCNLIEPVSVLWSTRVWDANAQDFKRALPTETGFQRPFEIRHHSRQEVSDHWHEERTTTNCVVRGSKPRRLDRPLRQVIFRTRS